MDPKLEVLQAILREGISKPYGRSDSIVKCGTAALSIIQQRPEDILQLSHERLHSFPYKDVPECWRRLYTDAAIWKTLTLDAEVDFETKLVEILDMAVILTGAPLRESLIRDVFSLLGQNGDMSDSVIYDETPTTKEHKNDGCPRAPKSSPLYAAENAKPETYEDPPNTTYKHVSKRQKLFHRSHSRSDIPTSFPQQVPPPNIPLHHPLPRHTNPTLTSFQGHLSTFHKLNNQQGPLPFIITDAITQWPAISDPNRCWSNPQNWMKSTLDGRRLVPIEIGRAYTDDDWSQKIVTFGVFMRDYLLPNDTRMKEVVSGPKATEGKKRKTGYLAQHDLFSQIPPLRNDIITPDYCYSTPPSPVSTTTTNPDPPDTHSDEEDSSSASSIATNIWLGPANTTSPLHTDPHHNILAQVFGYKYIRLYAPDQTDKLYPRSKEGADVDMSNTSLVDVGMVIGDFDDDRADSNDEDFEEESAEVRGGKDGDNGEKSVNREGKERKRQCEARKKQFELDFPLFKDASYVEGILGPGECLFIPRGWWHYVRSLSPSCSVSFWWD